MPYHPSHLKRETRERIMDATRPVFRLTERERLVVEVKARRMVLNGNPSATLAAQCEARIAAITRRLAALTEEEARSILKAVLKLET